jgi:hypothetical protein
LSDSKGIRDLLSTHKASRGLPPEAQKELKKDFLILRSYYKGVANEREFLDPEKRGA